MFLIVSKYLIPNGYRAIALYPFVIVRNKDDRNDAVLINHERIHLRQQLELLIILFYVWYFVDFMVKIIQYRDRNAAYRNIVFEREAYAREKEYGYLGSRLAFNFIHYYKL